MPDIMNVLLAESQRGLEYNMLVEMEILIPQFSNTDIVLVVGG